MSRSARSGAVLLAGGASTRMGEDKAWLRVGDATLLEHVVSVLLEAVDVVVVVGRPGQALPPLVATVERVDDHPALAGGGPLVGIAAGLARLDSIGVERAYLGSVDAPSLTVAHVAWIDLRAA